MSRLLLFVPLKTAAVSTPLSSSRTKPALLKGFRGAGLFSLIASLQSPRSRNLMRVFCESSSPRSSAPWNPTITIGSEPSSFPLSFHPLTTFFFCSVSSFVYLVLEGKWNAWYLQIICLGIHDILRLYGLLILICYSTIVLVYICVILNGKCRGFYYIICIYLFVMGKLEKGYPYFLPDVYFLFPCHPKCRVDDPSALP